MGEVRLFSNIGFDEIKQLQEEKKNDFMGVVYAVEYDNSVCKIGYTQFPKDRTSLLNHLIRDYMRKDVTKIAISEWHTNFKENELRLHDMFSESRYENSELFEVKIMDVVNAMSKIEYRDDSKRLIEECEQNSDRLIEFGKYVMFGGLDRDWDKKNSYGLTRESTEKYLTEEDVRRAKELVGAYEEYLEFMRRKQVGELKSAILDYWIQEKLVPSVDDWFKQR